ncbi:PhoX family protein [Nannocystaceae bacterium ST9]
MTRHHLPRLGTSTLAALLALSACNNPTEPDDEIGDTDTTSDGESDSSSESTSSESDSSSESTSSESDESEGDESEDDESEDDESDSTDTDTGIEPIDPSELRPLSAMVSFSLDPETGASDIPSLVKQLVEQVDAGTLPMDVEFPLAVDTTDSVRAIAGLRTSIVARWFEPLTLDESAAGPRYGANNDYIAYFGDGWTGAPQFSGSGTSGWLWANHEYISGDQPTAMSGPTGQFVLLGWFLHFFGMIPNPEAQTWTDDELAAVITAHKQQVGGSWFRVQQDPRTGEWAIDREADNHRYDATSATLVKVTGLPLSGPAHDDQGNQLPEGVVPGIMSDCSGAQTPWGTIITAEENVQSYYGDVEPCWSSQQQFLVDSGCDAGADIMLATAPTDDGLFSSHPDPNHHHDADSYGYLVEIDPGMPADEYYGKTNPGEGHQKLGAIGRAHWENTTFAVGPDWRLVAGQPIVMYSGDDRRSGRIYKFVTSQPYTAGMSKAQIRGLLAAGTLHVAHFAELDNDQGLTVDGQLPTATTPASGQWIEISTTSTDLAPNAPTLGAGTTVGEALLDPNWNGIAGFPDDATVRRALFTAANKIGVRELNRPEDIEFNPVTGRLHVAFTNHGRRVALDDNGVLYDPATQEMDAPTRDDSLGAVFTIVEQGNPASSTSFEFWAAWAGSEGEGIYDAANPDNLVIDAEGGLWFGTDGNYGTNGHADAIYYLDLDPSHVETFGKAFRIVAGPSDSEATGPALTSDSRTLLFSVQHPGESEASTWPN